MESTFNHPVVGEVTVVRSNRARRVSLSVRPDGSVRLSIPFYYPVREALRFLEAKLPWVTAAQNRVRARYKPHPIAELYETRQHVLQLLSHTCGRIMVSLVPPKNEVKGIIRVKYPEGDNPSGLEVQRAIHEGIERAWRAEAKSLLPVRVACLAQECGLKYRSVTVRNSKSRWGSCSAHDDISLSLHLMRLPDHLIDYVIIHELCHTVHRNHGAGFYALLDRLTDGNAIALRNELKQFSPRW